MINKQFKDEVRSLFEDHLDKNLDQDVDGKLNASQRRVPMTKWVGEAWSKVGKMKDSIIRSFFQEEWLISGIRWKWEWWSQHWGNAIILCEYLLDEYVLDDDSVSEKEDKDKGNAKNEEEFQILIHSDLPTVTKWYSFKNRGT